MSTNFSKLLIGTAMVLVLTSFTDTNANAQFGGGGAAAERKKERTVKDGKVREGEEIKRKRMGSDDSSGDDKKARMRERFKNLSPEEQAKIKEKHKKRIEEKAGKPFDQLTPEERQRAKDSLKHDRMNKIDERVENANPKLKKHIYTISDELYGKGFNVLTPEEKWNVIKEFKARKARMQGAKGKHDGMGLGARGNERKSPTADGKRGAGAFGGGAFSSAKDGAVEPVGDNIFSDLEDDDSDLDDVLDSLGDTMEKTRDAFGRGNSR